MVMAAGLLQGGTTAVGCRRASVCLLVAVLCCITCLQLPAHAADLPPCPLVPSNGHLTVTRDCAWVKQPVPAHGHVVLDASQVITGVPPAITLQDDGQPSEVAPGFTLVIKRLVLRNATLAPGSSNGGPRLLPEGLFTATPRNLSVWDTRVVVEAEDFDDYVRLFRSQLRQARGIEAGPSFTTDNTSVLNVPYWSDNSTEIFSMSLISGPCNLQSERVTPWSRSIQLFAVTPGCNWRAANNATLVPLLLRDAGNVTSQPLIIRLLSNITLGPGLTQAIPIRRPIVLLGFASSPTSIDFAMMVNVLNVSRTGSIMWQSLVLENLAPGDAVSSITAPPFSTTVSSNVWAMYCNRSAQPCLIANNVTMVVPFQEELNYQVFMYTMFNSPAPALKELTEFYRTDLNTSVVQFVPGPGNDTVTVIRLVNTGWDFWYVISTLRPQVAPKRPLPRMAFVLQRYRAGALVYALQDCGGFTAALASRSTSTRTRVWTLINNVSIADQGHVLCPWPDGNVTYPTQLLGPIVHTHGPSARVRETQAVADPLSPEAIVLGHADANTKRGIPSSNGAPVADPYLPYDEPRAGEGVTTPPLAVFALSFGYMPSLFQLPADAQDKFLQIQNITLMQLPQMAPTRGLKGLRRLLQQAPPTNGFPVGIWTLLLWPIRRTMYGAPVTISDSKLVIPQPEFDLLAEEARTAPSFAMQLQGDAGGLTFTGVSLVDNHTMRVGAYNGPGVSGTNVWLCPDPQAAKMPGYSWPHQLFDAARAGGSGGSSGGGEGTQHSVGLRAGIGVLVGVLGLLGVGLVAVLVRVRRRHRHAKKQPGQKEVAGAALNSGLGPGKDAAGSGCSLGADSKVLLGVGPDGTADVVGVLDTDGQQHIGKQRGTAAELAAAAAVAAGAGATAGAAAAAPGKRRSRGKVGSAEQRPASAHRCDKCSSGRQHQPGATGVQGHEEGESSCSQQGSSAVRAAGAAGAVAGRGVRSSSNSSAAAPTVEQTIAHGLQRWNAAVSTTTMQLMQRRLQSHNALAYGHASSTASSSGAGTGCSQQPSAAATAAAEGCSPKKQSDKPSAAAMSSAHSGSDGDQGLQLQGIIGTGSFGSVYLGLWRGKQVAVKVMHLPCNELLDSDTPTSSQDVSQDTQDKQLQQRKQNSPPHMAIMEAVVSSTMSHPNVVQVFTYMLQPLMVQPGTEAGVGPAVRLQKGCSPPQSQQQQQQQAEQLNGEQQQAAGNEKDPGVFGWQLRLVMQYCDKGTLREALDRRTGLPRLPGTSFPHPAVVFSISHDVAAAMLHLHSEGIVHGDLKAGNVLLAADPSPGSSSSSRSWQVWREAGSQPLSAKVADFGLAMPLGPKDTHATMLARGTPTHMSPEIFLAGHVSKASDVYAYGILLYELVTGRRAYQGVPIPLLPFEVSVKGLRPVWPDNVPAESAKLCELAEACWVEKAQDRPSFDHILNAIEAAAAIIPKEATQQQQQQQPDAPEQQPAAAGPAAGAAVALPGAGRVSPGAVGRKASKAEQLSWSEISYGGSKHGGGWL